MKREMGIKSLDKVSFKTGWIIHKRKKITNWTPFKCKTPVLRTILLRKATDWRKIFSEHVSDKRFTSRICKALSKLDNTKTNSLI